MTARKTEDVFETLLNNQWIGSESGETVPIYAPDDHAVVGSVPALSQEEV